LKSLAGCLAQQDPARHLADLGDISPNMDRLENRGWSGVYLRRVLVFVYGELKFEKLNLCELLLKINFLGDVDETSKNTSHTRKMEM
jgi:hypothetical protein